MPNVRVLCIFTTLLGHKTTVRKLTDALDHIPGFEPTYVLIGNEDYAAYPPPLWARATHPWQGQYMARQKAKATIAQPFDVLFVNAWEYVVAFRDLARQIPAVAMMDNVPATIDLQQRLQGMTGWRRSLSHQIHHRAFAKAVSEFDLFLPMGSDCGDALHSQYGVARQNCFLTLAPQDLEASKPGPRTFSSPMRLLFVGNDFMRKGGEFLLRLYSEHLAGKCTLTIVSSDPGLAGRILPEGVEKLGPISLDHLHQIFRESHLFAFPTQQDFMPQVLAEALAFGLPCMANDVGGVRDLVQDGETGFLMSRDAPPEVWAQRLQRLAANPSELSRMSACARRFAEERLSLDRFKRLIADVLRRLAPPPRA
jgi:hypothetical protein